ncbi:MAG: translocation/assembly module TamB domain-containing protein [Candidatus Eisenbacteria bacterium]|nr:translocation/assembly module TamB domain-containing protein [Candidatus Eisenbacteria bacterium]
MRLRGLKIAGVVLVSAVAVVAVAVVLLWQTDRAAINTRLAKLAQEFLIANDSTRIEISSISGNAVGSVTLHDVSLFVRDGKDWRSVLTARKIKLGYSLWELARRRFVLNQVEIEEPVCSLTKGARGTYLWPRFGKGGKGKGTKFVIGSLVIERGEFRIGRRGEKGLFDDISMRSSLTSGPDGIALKGLEVSFAASTWKYTVESCSGDLLFREGRMWLQSLDVRTAGSSYNVDGFIGLGHPMDVEIKVLVDTLSIVELKGMKTLAFLPGEGKVSGSATFSRKGGGPTRITSLLSGTYGTHVIDTLQSVTTAKNGKWENQFRMESQGSVIEGTFNAGPGTLQECAVDFVSFDPRAWPEIFTEARIPEGSLNGAFRFSGNSLVSPQRKGEIQVALDGGSYAGLSFLEGKGEGSFDGEGSLVFSSIDFRGAGYNVTAFGTVGPKATIDAAFRASVEKLGEFAPLRGKFDVESELTVSGKLHGTGERLTIETDLSGELLRTSPSTVSGVLRDGRVEGELWPLLSLSAKAVLSPGEVRGSGFDSLTVETLIEKPRDGSRRAEVAKDNGEGWCSPVVVVSGNARAVRGDTVITAEATLDCCESGVQVRVENLVASLGQSVWRNEGTVHLGWHRGTMEVADLVLFSGESRIELAGSTEPAKKRAAGRLTVVSLDVRGVAGKFVPAAGKMDADVTFEQTDSGSSLDGRVDWSDASFGERTFDRLSLSASVSNNEIHLKQVEVVKAQGKITASGELHLPIHFGEFIDSLRSRRSVPRGVQANLDVVTAGLSLSEFSQWHPALASLSGIVDARIRIDGFLENPRMTISSDAKDFRIRKYQVAGLELRATLADGVCNISRLGVMEGNAKGEAQGFFPVALNLGTGHLSFPDGAVDVSVKLSESDLSVISLFVKQIASASGLTKGEARISGTLRNPTLKGGFEITNATLRLVGREEVLENVNAQVSLNERAIELVSFTATQGEEGRLEGSGRIPLGKTEGAGYSFAIKGKKVTFGDPEDIALKFDCDLVISAVEVRDRGTYPKITGKIDVKQGIIAREFQSVQGPQEEQRWLCDVRVEVVNNLWLKNINTEIELAGSVTARKDMSGLILLGSLTILRGKYYVFDNEFTITSGTLEFKDVGRIDPEMNIKAETSASGRIVYLTLTGKLSEPTIVLASDDSNLSQTDILRLLTVGKYATTESGQTGDTGLMPGVTGSVGNYFLRQVERRLARELKWVDSIELGGDLEGTSAMSELRWGLGKYITPEIYLRYSQGLTKMSGRDVSVEYRLSSLLFLRGGVSSRDRFAGRERDEYNLDLRLKYEY